MNPERLAPETPKTVARVEAVKARVFLGIAAGLIVFFLVFWYAMDVFLLVFASILMGVFLRRLAVWIRDKMRLSYAVSLTLVLFATASFLVLGTWLLVPEVSQQMEALSEQIPKSWDHWRSQLEHWPWIKRLLNSALAPNEGGKAAVSAIPTVLSRSGTLIGAGIFIMFSGVFLAAEPDTYLNGFEKLFPIPRRSRVHEILLSIGNALSGWIAAQLILMGVVGSLTGVGLYILKMPMALTLGVLTAVLLFIPYTGSILSAVPAILIALMNSTSLALSVVVLYIGAHIVEAYVVGPIVQKRVLKLPPAMTLSFQLLMGVLGGIPGLALSTPTAAMLVVLIRMAYVEDVLRDQPSLTSERIAS